MCILVALSKSLKLLMHAYIGFCPQCDYEVKLTGGKPGESICNVIKHDNIDLVVMGSRGMGSIRRTFVGSVSDYVLHHAHVPVIICPKH